MKADMNTTTWMARLTESYRRGRLRGESDEYNNYYNDAPLSGEWAGESINELLGDLWADMDSADEDTLEVIDELVHHYEDGYNSAFAERVFCDECGDLVDATYGITNDVIVLCGKNCNDLGGE